MAADNGLVPLLAALRTRGDEAQLTQVIADVARADPAWARDLANVLVEAA
jgi:hypothetical protein